eukprot:jgi/Bigna1/75876/fgenesh1_pg.37_\
MRVFLASLWNFEQNCRDEYSSSLSHFNLKPRSPNVDSQWGIWMKNHHGEKMENVNRGTIGFTTNLSVPCSITTPAPDQYRTSERPGAVKTILATAKSWATYTALLCSVSDRRRNVHSRKLSNFPRICVLTGDLCRNLIVFFLRLEFSAAAPCLKEN